MRVAGRGLRLGSEAQAAFEQGLEDLQHLPENTDTGTQAIDLWLALRTALMPDSDPSRLQDCLNEAATLSERLEDSHRLGQISVFLAVQYYISAEYDQVIAQGQRALAVAKSHQDVGLQASGNTYMGFAHYLRGDYDQSMACLQWTIESLSGDLAQERFGSAVSPALHAYAWLAQNHAELGSFAEGIACGEAGIRLAEAVSSPASEICAYRGIGLLYLRKGDLARALPLLERAVAICQDMHAMTYFVTVAPSLGAVYTLSGRLDDAVSLLTQTVEQSVESRIMMAQSLCVAFLGEAHLLVGHLEDASKCFQQALALAHTHEERGYQAYIQRLLGDLAMHRDPPEFEQADTHYQEALTLANELGMRPLQAHCHRGLGTLYSQTGQSEQARAELSTAIEMYREMEMTFWLPEAEAALAEVEGKV